MRDAVSAAPGVPTTPVTLKFLRHDNPDYARADDDFIAEYRVLHPNVTVVATNLDSATLRALLNGDLKNGQLDFDLVRVGPSFLCGYADFVEDVPVDVISLPEAQNTFFAAPLEGSTCKGNKLKGVPVEYNLEYGGVVVNTDKFQAKLGRPPGWSDWASFIKDASALTEYDAAGKPMANGLDIDPAWTPPTRHIFMAQILQRGGTYLLPSGEFNFNTPEAAAALTEMVSWIKDAKVLFPEIIPMQNTGVNVRLAAGAAGFGWGDAGKPLAVMGYVGTWGLVSARGRVPAGSDWHFDFVPLPPMVGTEHKFVTDAGWAFMVPKTSRQSAVAWDFIKSFALSPAAMRKWAATTGSLPALKANGTAAAATTDPLLAKVQPLLEKGRWRGFVPTEAVNTANGSMVTNFFAAAAGQKDIATALADMQKTVNETIARYK